MDERSPGSCAPDGASPGAASWYAQHADPTFMEACYAAAPPRIRAALADEIRYLESALADSGSVLEIGCGDGRLLEALGRSARRWIGLDFLEPYLHQAKATRRLADGTGLVAASAADLPFAAESFDAVLCAQNTFGLLGALKEPALREAARVTRRGGRIVLVVYSVDSIAPRAEWYTEMHRRGAMQPIDWSRSGPELLATFDGHGSESFRRERLERLLAEAGLRASVEPVGAIYWSAKARKA
jgi:ubiquinone/menaquinone biosynthesis C-methylase UbiE